MDALDLDLTPRHQELLVRGYTDIYKQDEPGDGRAGDDVCVLLSPNVDTKAKEDRKDDLLCDQYVLACKVEQNNVELERKREEIERQKGIIKVSEELGKYDYTCDFTQYAEMVSRLKEECAKLEEEIKENVNRVRQMNRQMNLLEREYIVHLAETGSEPDSSDDDVKKKPKESKKDEAKRKAAEAKRKKEEEARAKRMAPLRKKYEEIPKGLTSRTEAVEKKKLEKEIERLEKLKGRIATMNSINRVKEVEGLLADTKIRLQFKEEKEKLEKLNGEIFDLARERIKELKSPQVTDVSEPVKKRKPHEAEEKPATPPAKKPKTILKFLRPKKRTEEKPAKKQALPMSTGSETDETGSETYETSRWGRAERHRRQKRLSKHFKEHLSCPECNLEMKTFQCLQSHLSTKDIQRPCDTKWDLDTRKFKCLEPECLHEFGYRSGVRRFSKLRDHYKTHHSELGEMALGLQFYKKGKLELYKRRLENVMDLSFRLHYYRTVKGEEIKNFKIELNLKGATASFQRSGKWGEYVL